MNQTRPRPIPWKVRKGMIGRTWLKPYHAVEHLCDWVAHLMSGWVVVEALEYIGKFSVLAAVVFYFAESGDRRKQKHYQAWQVINTAQGKGGSGGRIEALHELNQDKVPLVGVNLEGSFLQGLRLYKADLTRADLGGADLRNAVLQASTFSFANLRAANLRDSDLRKANLEDAVLAEADLFGADLRGTRLARADLSEADFRNANLEGAQWQGVASVRLANVHAVKNAPSGFMEWALRQGAVDVERDEAWEALFKH